MCVCVCVCVCACVCVCVCRVKKTNSGARGLGKKDVKVKAGVMSWLI